MLPTEFFDQLRLRALRIGVCKSQEKTACWHMLSIHASPAAVQHMSRDIKRVWFVVSTVPFPSTFKPLQQPMKDRHRNKYVT